MQCEPPHVPWYHVKLSRAETVTSHRFRFGYVPLKKFEVFGVSENVHLLMECVRTELIRVL